MQEVRREIQAIKYVACNEYVHGSPPYLNFVSPVNDEGMVPTRLFMLRERRLVQASKQASKQTNKQVITRSAGN